MKVFYSKVRLALADGYTDFDRRVYSKMDGYLYSFTGLRGDAKSLYKKVVAGTERRVKLVQAPTWEDQRPYVERADVVIWACGYETNKVPLYAMDGQLIKRMQRVPRTQCNISTQLQLVTSNSTVLNKVYGMGIGYPTHT